MTNMNSKLMRRLIGLSLIALGGIGCGSQANNPCTTWLADNGPYTARYDLKAGTESTPGCVAAALGGQTSMYDRLYVQQYANPDPQAENIASTYSMTIGPRPLRNSTEAPFASGKFDNNGIANANNECTVADFSVASDTGAALSYHFSNVTLLEEAFSQGSEFKGDLTLTMGTCTADFSVIAIAPFVACATDADCSPVPQAGAQFGSGLAPQYHTFCDLGPAATAYTGGVGLCVPMDAYPSLCPNGGLADSTPGCQTGKPLATATNG